jgi:primosomal replication protein N
VNHARLLAVIAERAAMRYTPAGLPALDLILEHSSEQNEVDNRRKVQLRIRALALGEVAERLNGKEMGSSWLFGGFLATPRQGKSVVLHIQDFQQD